MLLDEKTKKPVSDAMILLALRQYEDRVKWAEKKAADLERLVQGAQTHFQLRHQITLPRCGYLDPLMDYVDGWEDLRTAREEADRACGTEHYAVLDGKVIVSDEGTP